MNEQYPDATIRALLTTNEVTAATREVFVRRLEKELVTKPSFFDEASFDVLQAVCDCLIPQPASRQKIDLAGLLDDAFHSGKGIGWRYDQLPPLHEAFKMGLNGIQASAHSKFGKPFQQLDDAQRKNLMESIQFNKCDGNSWSALPSHIFFEELLARITELYYSHPLALEEIGVVSMADAKGWARIGLNNLEDREPKPFFNNGDD